MIKKIYLASFLMTFLFFVSCQEEGFILNDDYTIC